MVGGRHSSTRDERGGRSLGFYLICAVVVVGLAASVVVIVQEVRSWTGGCDQLSEYTLAADPSIAPTLSDILGEAKDTDTGCATIAVSAATSGDIAGRLGKGTDAPDLWIPDTGAWVGKAALTAAGPVEVMTGSIASSPIVLVSREGEAPAPQTWLAALHLENIQLGNPLVTGVAQGPITAALAEGESDPVSTGTVRAALVPLAQEESARTTDEPIGVEMLRGVADNGGVAVATEQAVVDYTADTGPGLVATVPPTGSNFMNFPLVVTSPAPDRHYKATQVARAVAEVLGSESSRTAFADSGFRGPDGSPLPGGRGVGEVPDLGLTEETVLQDALGAWALMALPIRTLVAIDVSGSMETPAGNRSRMDLTVDAALAGNAMFPDSVSAGLWAFSQGLGGGPQDYREMVPIRRYDTVVDGLTQRQVMAQQAEKVDGLVGGATGLYDTALAAFRTVQETYDPRAVNSVIILTDGANEDPDSITKEQLLSILEREMDPARPVIIVTIGITDDADAATLAEISRVTGGSSYVAKDPADISNVFVNALAARGR
ncbi:substrate-binding and VWA domain-containing protein [Rhodococcus tibetensis]|uniref:Substrate-binding and VWA domain-containing protein n=1 Tax=Rhodococcus tibetensis TaxID=2965064 RepID=A0ABT1QCI7_9NOCA|nr:substrate-binding and VWA domain-containing protein [Rhodococcus sp. FXJ9.536]MCQ4119912.1 substrate-binding and VWA domain-containing protein [Rhodococcus sp. FXJ9.536]